jgi:predicted Zn-dependent protease
VREVLLIVAALSFAGCAARTNPAFAPKPGFNLFPKEQDIQIGRQAAAQVLQQYPVVQNQFLQDYIRRVGTHLASQPPAEGFPYSFTLLHVRQVNAFALPGGPVFVFTQLVLFTDNEAQLAGVLAHEISHVALRHGTNQLSKQKLIELPAALAGSAIDGGVMGKILKAGLGVGLNGLFLHYSRKDESEADALGTRIMAAAGYNPIEMAHIFEKLAAQGGPGVPQFLSDHPSPGNRVKAIEAIIRTLPQQAYNFETGDFPRAKQLIQELPPPPPPRKVQQ